LEYSVDRSHRTRPYAGLILRLIAIPFVILGLSLVLAMLNVNGPGQGFLADYFVGPFLWLLIILCVIVWFLLVVLLIVTVNNNRRAARVKHLG
jgi:small-conductance mechanosensitive channel